MSDPDEESAGAVLHRWPDDADEPLYLLLHYPAGHWDFPKGHIEPGEDEVEALIREVEEETGIAPERVQVLDGFREPTRYTYERAGRRRRKVVWYHLALTDAEQVRLSHEHINWRWLPYEGAVAQITYDDTRAILEKAHEVILQRSRPSGR